MRRTISRQWQSHVRPALFARAYALRDRATTTLRRSEDAPATQAYDSLADAVRNRGWADARG